MTDTYSFIIDGRSVPADRHFPVCNPADGSVVGHAPEAEPAILDAAVDAARKAFTTWSATSDRERREACVAVAQILMNHAEEIARLITLEQGKPLNGPGSRFELAAAQIWSRHTATLDLSPVILQDNPEGRVERHWRPLGVVGSITPWNWPVMIGIWHILPAIRTGNAVVCKPSELTPLSTIRVIELMNRILPPGVVNCVTGGREIGAAMSAHPGLDKIVFTGSSATGRNIMRSGADTLKRLTLELGGNDAGIVLEDVDPEKIAKDIFWGAFLNSGQTCAALKRLYVHESVHDELVREVAKIAKSVKVGNGLKESTELGPVQNATQLEKVRNLVQSAVDAGGKVHAGGLDHRKNEGLFLQPTIVADLDHGCPLVEEEQFGPALPIVRYSDLDDVIERANRNPNGLGGSVWTRNRDKAREVALRMECGSVWRNKHGAIQPNAPFGGVKQSGIGVEFGQEGLAEYLEGTSVFL